MLKKLISGCGCLVVGAVLCFIGIVFVSTTKVATQSENVGFVESSYDKAGAYMEAYATIGVPEFREKCIEFKRQRSGLDRFQCAVLFDARENVGFPSVPFSAGYGLEESRMKHIKAFYMFNPLNGHSKLSVYKKNMWESKAIDEEL
ncbi:MAG: hypothetical protein ABL949_17175 [Fimbriimonadaceae bacterium]